MRVALVGHVLVVRLSREVPCHKVLQYLVASPGRIGDVRQQQRIDALGAGSSRFQPLLVLLRLDLGAPPICCCHAYNPINP